MLRNWSLSRSRPILDQLSVSAAAAYSLRKVRTAYAGSAIRVRRSSDNAELDIGFSGNELDTTALLAHCGAGNGFVTTWYDQSGNASNATQATAANQPQIVSNGAIETENGRAALFFDGANDVLLMTEAAIFVRTVNVVAKWVLDNANYRPLLGSTWGYPFHGGLGGQGGALFLNSSDWGASAGKFINGVQALSNDLLTRYTDNTIYVFSSSSSVFFNTLAQDRGYSYRVFYGKMQEVISIDAVLSTTDRQTLERNQGAYYSITVA